MLLPNPAVLIIQVGCLLLIAFVLIEDRRAMRRVRARVDPFSADNPSGKPTTILRPRTRIVHRAAIWAAIVLVLMTLYSFAEGLYEWGPHYLDRWLEPENLAVSIMLVLLLLIAPGLPARRPAQELFLASDADLTRMIGKEGERLLWKDVGSMTARPQGIPLLIRLSTSRAYIVAHLTIEGVERFYQRALRSLPEPLRQSDAFAWSASKVAVHKRPGADT